MPEKKNSGIIGIIILVMIVALFFVATSFLNRQKAVKISCKTGEFLEFASISMPQMCAGCTDYCEGSLVLKDENGNLVCQNKYKSDSYETVFIPCPELKNNKGKKLVITYSTYSPAYGNFTGTVEKIYGK